MSEVGQEDVSESAKIWNMICSYVAEFKAGAELLKEAIEEERAKKAEICSKLDSASASIGNMRALLEKNKQDNIDMQKMIDEMKASTREILSDIDGQN